MEKHQVRSGGRRSQRKCEQELSLWFPWEQTREAEEASLASSSLNNFSGFCSIQVVLSCLVSNPGKLGQIHREWTGGEGMGSQFVSLYLKGLHMGKLFTISRNWLILGGALTSKLAMPQMSKHLQKIKDMDNALQVSQKDPCLSFKKKLVF